jgi:hypothetical protein
MKMADIALISTIVTATDILMPVTMLAIALTFRAANPGTSGARILGGLTLAAVAWGALWAWFPPVAALRLAPPPGGQVMAILGVVLTFIAFRFTAPVKAYWQNAKLEKLVWNGPWRAIYGSSLLLIGLSGGLPNEFVWSAAVADIVVGVWAIAILMRGANVKRGEILGWNALGAIDLFHVLVLGAIFLRPFYLANPEMPLLNLLPLAGVPVLLAAHVMTLTGFWVQRKTSRTPMHLVPA